MITTVESRTRIPSHVVDGMPLGQLLISWLRMGCAAVLIHAFFVLSGCAVCGHLAVARSTLVDGRIYSTRK